MIPAEAVTAIEVLEHTPNPLEFVAEVLTATRSSTLVFTQELHSPGTSTDWWYFLPETGQHLSFFSLETLHVMARELDLHLATYRGLYMFSTQKVSLPVDHGRLRTHVTRRFTPRTSRPTLTWSDHLAMRVEVENPSRSDTS